MDKTLLKGLMVLEVMASHGDKLLTIQSLAVELGLTKSNTHRTLQTLSHAGYVVRDDATGNYRSTLKMFEMGAKQVATLDVGRFARPYMLDLAQVTQESVALTVLDAGSVIYVDMIDSPQPVGAHSIVGNRVPAYCVATGKVLLAFQPEEYLSNYNRNLVAYTAATIIDPIVLRAELKQIALCGFAINRGEWRDTVCGVAAPIFDGFGDVVAAIGISAPLDRCSKKRMKELSQEVLKAGCDISRSMGYSQEYFNVCKP